MKKILVLLVVLVGLTSFGQKKLSHIVHSSPMSKISDSIKIETPSLKKYISIGMSISSGNTYDTNENKYSFSESCYPSIEGGITYSNVSLGIVLGRGNFKGLGSSQDVIQNYYYEFKVSPSFPLGILDANIIFGVGSYINASNAMFIEYGSGISYTKNNFTYGVNYTNWDGVDYITPCLTYNFD